MKIISKLSLLLTFALTLGMFALSGTPAQAQSSFFSSRGCVDCHAAPTVASCNGCHYHGNRSLKATTSKTVYAPGETVSVTLTSGSTRSGWIKANLYNQSNTLVATSSGTASGMGGATTFPATLTAAAPTAPGTYTWKMAYYGNNNGTGSGDVHSEAAVSTNSFTVAAPADTAAPTVSAFTLPATSTSLSVPVSTLTASDNVAVTGYLVTTSAAAPAASAAGWSAAKPTSVTAPGEGNVTFYAWARDAAGNVSASRSAAVTVITTVADTVNPTLTISMLADGTVTNNPTLNVSGNASDNVALQAVTVNGSNVPFDGTGNFSTAIELVAGSNTITVVATDAAGNSTTKSRTVTYATGAPTLSITAPADNLVSAQEIVAIEGTVDANSTVTVSVNDGPPQVASLSGTDFSASVYLEPGINTLDIKSVTPSGAVSDAKRTVVFDNDSPSVAITRPVEDKIVRSRVTVVKGKVADALSDVKVTLTVDGKKFKAKVVNGKFNKRITLAGKGPHAITVTATDEAGNQAVATRNLIFKKPKNGAKLPSQASSAATRLENQDAAGQNALAGRILETILLGAGH